MIVETPPSLTPTQRRTAELLDAAAQRFAAEELPGATTQIGWIDAGYYVALFKDGYALGKRVGEDPNERDVWVAVRLVARGLLLQARVREHDAWIRAKAKAEGWKKDGAPFLVMLPDAERTVFRVTPGNWVDAL